MKILITGISSFLGHHILRSIPSGHSICGSYFSNLLRHKSIKAVRLDITDRQSVRNCVDSFAPDIIIHIAAMSVVSACEKNPEQAYLTNVEGSRNIAEVCGNKIRLIHISTDMVFNGRKTGYYCEDDKPDPITVYGKTKLEGEKAVQAVCRNAVILRPTLMYGADINTQRGFLFWMKEQAIRNKKVNLFINQYRTPLFIEDACRLIWNFAENHHKGVFHAGGPDRLNRVEIGQKYLPMAGISKDVIVPVKIEDVSVSYGIQGNLCLNSNKVRELLNFKFTSFNQGIKLSLQ